MTNQDKERGEFEALFRPKWRKGSHLQRLESGLYLNDYFHAAWEGWQASAERYQSRIAELEAEVVRLKAEDMQKTTGRPDKAGVYVWCSGDGLTSSLVLVNKRPSGHSNGGVLNGHIIESNKFYSGCAITSWPDKGWIKLRDFDESTKGGA